MDAAVAEAFAKLKLLKVFDFYKTRVLTPEQEDRVQFICDRYLNAFPQERESIRSLVTPESRFYFSCTPEPRRSSQLENETRKKSSKA
jgi:hypothetical protein